MDGIVSEMYVEICPLFEAELRGGSSDVALRKPISLDDAVEGCQKHVVSDIELSALV